MDFFNDRIIAIPFMFSVTKKLYFHYLSDVYQLGFQILISYLLDFLSN